MNKNRLIALGALSGLLAVMLGAFGAHGLEKILPGQMLQRYHTGVQYHFFHALALLITGLLQYHFTSKYLYYAGWAFVAGTVLFSGSLYLYAVTGIRSFGMVTPLGGLAFIIGWLSIVLATWHARPHK